MTDMSHGAAVLEQPVDEEQLLDVLVSSIYPGASRESAAMAHGYCKAAGLDVMLKPVHIVPMRVKTGGKDRYGNDEYTMRDVVMPGVGLYRIQAARTGQYAGMDEPVLGPMRTLKYTAVKREWIDDGKKPDGSPKRKPKDTFTEKELQYPEWVQVTVYRLVGGFRHPFPAREWWIENYATAGPNSEAPNAMWARRTIGQLIKCAEAQALRKGFPEVGSQPTAEELQGREFDIVDAEPAEPAAQTALRPQRASETGATSGNTSTARPALTDDTAAQQQAQAMVQPTASKVDAEPVARQAAATPPPPPAQASAPAPAPATEESPPASEGEVKNILVNVKARGLNLAELLATLGFTLDANTLQGLTKAQFKAIKGKL